MGTEVQGLWDGAVPSGLLEWQAALSPPHAALFARVYSDFTSESPEQQKSKRVWPVQVSIELFATNDHHRPSDPPQRKAQNYISNFHSNPSLTWDQ